ncbi:MAG: hypothetical protein EOP68_13940 [Sphingomonas sp.]|nr:MAG: hypothetical protein EOP68_13940 [Sphingomonas sp.]
MILPSDLAQAVRDQAIEKGYAGDTDVIRQRLATTSHDIRGSSQEEAYLIGREYAARQAGTLETVSVEEFPAEIAADRAAGR